MRQEWHDVLFAHWALAPESLRPLVPGQLELDTFDGRAWVGLVPFWMSGVRLRGTPALPWVSAFPELNLRTYVRVGDRSGVHFLSLDGDSRPAVAVARRWFHLPYYRAKMGFSRQDDTIHYKSRRSHRGAPAVAFRASYAPVGDSEVPANGSLERWLVERYRLFAVDSRGRVVRAEVQHPPWELSNARLQARENTMGAGFGLELRAPPDHLVFSRKQEALFEAPKRD